MSLLLQENHLAVCKHEEMKEVIRDLACRI